ncbi:MAG: SCO family protein [Candidatus Dadabacteria bacterium]
MNKKLLGILIIAVLAAAGLALFVRPGDSKDASPYYGIYYGKDAPDFTLLDPEGNSVSISDFEGEEVLLTFGYTNCPDICPTTLSQLNAVTQKLGPEGRKDLEVLFVTIDPERDTGKRLGEYVPYFNESFIGLTGSQEAIKKAADAYSVFYEREKRGDSEVTYFMNHTQTLFLIDRSGKLLLLYPFENFDADKIAADIKLARQTNGTPK